MEKGLNCTIHIEGGLAIHFPFKLTKEQAIELMEDFKSPEPFMDFIFEDMPGGIVVKQKIIGIQFK